MGQLSVAFRSAKDAFLRGAKGETCFRADLRSLWGLPLLITLYPFSVKQFRELILRLPPQV